MSRLNISNSHDHFIFLVQWQVIIFFFLFNWCCSILFFILLTDLYTRQVFAGVLEIKSTVYMSKCILWLNNIWQIIFFVATCTFLWYNYWIFIQSETCGVFTVLFIHSMCWRLLWKSWLTKNWVCWQVQWGFFVCLLFFFPSQVFIFIYLTYFFFWMVVVAFLFQLSFVDVIVLWKFIIVEFFWIFVLIFLILILYLLILFFLWGNRKISDLIFHHKIFIILFFILFVLGNFWWSVIFFQFGNIIKLIF